MSSTPQQAGSAAPAERIDRNDPAQLRQWARQLDASPEQVEEAIDAVGDKLADVEMHLKGTRSTSNAERMDDAPGAR